MRYLIDTSETANNDDKDKLKLNNIVLSNGIQLIKENDTIQLLTEFIWFIDDKNDNSYEFTLIRLNKEQAAILGRMLIELSK
jgi:hypothetical protein